MRAIAESHSYKFDLAAGEKFEFLLVDLPLLEALNKAKKLLYVNINADV